MTRSNPTLAAARAKEQAAHEADQRTIRAAIIARKPHDLDELLEAFGLTDYDTGRGPRKPMRTPPDVDRMRALREQGYSLAEIGRKVGLHASTVGDHLKGRTRR